MEDIDVIVVGAGPVGLAAGLSCALHTDRQVSVRILERRLPIERWKEEAESAPWGGRLRNVVLDRRSIDFLESLGVCVPGERIGELHVLHGSEHSIFPATGAWARAYERVYSRLPSWLVSTGALERALLDVIGKLNTSGTAKIAVEFGVDRLDVDERGGGVHVRYRGEKGEACMVTARVVIVADGAHSPTLRKLGIGRTELGVSKVFDFLAADFADARPGAARAAYRFVPGDDVSWLGTSFTADGLTSLIMLSPTGTPGDSEALEAARRHEVAVRRMAAKMTIPDRLVGKVYPFSNRIDRADKVQSGSFYVMGAAARKTNPASGNGINIGLLDVRLCRHIFGQWVDGDSRSAANSRYTVAIDANTAESTDGSLWVDEMMNWLLQDRRNFAFAQALWRCGLTPDDFIGNAFKAIIAAAAQTNPEAHARVVDFGLATATGVFGMPLPPGHGGSPNGTRKPRPSC